MTVLGCYWAPGHMRGSDLDYIRQLKPPAVRVFEPDSNKMNLAHQAHPDALLLPRIWALSEQHDDVQRNPQSTGQRHAREWHAMLNRWRSLGASLPPNNRIVVVGINEPRVWQMRDQVVAYNVAWLDECTQLGLRACALNLSVGWPANNAPGSPPDWAPYAPIEAAIRRGNHFLCLHEYWYKSGPLDNWGWWAGRVQHCPWDVPIIIGECGIDLYVDMPRWNQDGQPARGWQGNVDAAVYAGQLQEYARRLDTRVAAILPFLTDYYSNEWASFDTAGAHQQLLSLAGSMRPQAKPPGSTPPTSSKLAHPLPGAVITQHWGERAPEYSAGMWGHSGTDFGGKPEGTPVVCLAEGVVTWSDFDTGYGNYVRVLHSEFGLCSFYAHLSEPGAPLGTALHAGSTVGYLGSTGNSTGPHLHLELRLMDGSGYRTDCPMPRGRIDPETWCALNGLKL